MSVSDTIKKVWTEDEIEKIWKKGTIVQGKNPNVCRKDYCGAWIGRFYYGNRNHQYGWEVDHIIPVSKGGGDEISNLRPLQWTNNANKQAGSPECPVKASGDINIHVK